MGEMHTQELISSLTWPFYIALFDSKGEDCCKLSNSTCTYCLWFLEDSHVLSNVLSMPVMYIRIDWLKEKPTFLVNFKNITLQNTFVQVSQHIIIPPSAHQRQYSSCPFSSLVKGPLL